MTVGSDHDQYGKTPRTKGHPAMLHALFIVPPPFPPDPLPAMLRQLLAILSWLHGQGAVRPGAFIGLAAVLTPRSLSLVFDVEQDPPVLLGTFYGTAGDGNVVLYDDQRGGGGAIPAPPDCVEVVTYVPAVVPPGSANAPAVSATSLIDSDDEIDALRRRSTPIPGRDGVRQDSDGRVWYSARWLGLKS